MPRKAARSVISFRTTEARRGTSASPAGRSDRSTLEIGKVVEWRIRSGIGSGGEVTMSEGILRSSVAALKKAMALVNGEDGVDNASLGFAAKKTRGVVRRTATITESRESVLKERNLEGLVVVIGVAEPRR